MKCQFFRACGELKTGNMSKIRVRAVTLETLVTVREHMVPEICCFGKRAQFQNEVPDWRKQTKKSLILENIYTFFSGVIYESVYFMLGLCDITRGIAAGGEKLGF